MSNLHGIFLRYHKRRGYFDSKMISSNFQYALKHQICYEVGSNLCKSLNLKGLTSYGSSNFMNDRIGQVWAARRLAKIADFFKTQLVDL